MDERPGSRWNSFTAELLNTASQASWGVWVLCVVLLATFAVVLLGAAFSIIF